MRYLWFLLAFFMLGTLSSQEVEKKTDIQKPEKENDQKKSKEAIQAAQKSLKLTRLDHYEKLVSLHKETAKLQQQMQKIYRKFDPSKPGLEFQETLRFNQKAIVLCEQEVAKLMKELGLPKKRQIQLKITYDKKPLNNTLKVTIGIDNKLIEIKNNDIVEPGHYELTIVREGYKTYQKNVEILFAKDPFVIEHKLISQKKIAQILEQKIIYKQPDKYAAWPTIAKTRKKELIVVFSGDRDAHVCPWGKTQMMRSLDIGKTWEKQIVINSSLLDDRDAGVIETSKGTLLVSWFSSIAFSESIQVNWQKLPKLMTASWQRHMEKLGANAKEQWLGNWVRRSTDGGKTWGPYIDSIVSSPHGPVELADGRLLYIGNNYKCGQSELPEDRTKLLAAAESRDDGKSWKVIGYISAPDIVKSGQEFFYEPHMVENADGVLIAMFRYHGAPGTYYLWQSESKDGGKTWTTLQQTKIWGYPPHLILLRNNWLLVSYGRRRYPFGQRACISKDGGKTWDFDNEIVICEGPNMDLGYPASVQLDDGSIMTVFYQAEKSGAKTCIMTTHWKLLEENR